MTPIEAGAQVVFSVKQRNPNTGEWAFVDVNDLSGKTVADFLAQYSGLEAVAEFTFGSERVFFCGTDKWRERMSRKGKALLFTEAAVLLQAKCPALLSEVCPQVETVAGVFEGATVEKIIFTEEK